MENESLTISKILGIETKIRVKCVSLHATEPYILLSLFNGEIQMWSFEGAGLLIFKYKECNVATRSIQFAPRNPFLFASGGDDGVVRLWNCVTRECEVQMRGHEDSVRQVCFHPNLPWLMSTSDDMTIRIWDIESNDCIAIIEGHEHYVMDAIFNNTTPKEEFVKITSCSMDCTVRENTVFVNEMKKDSFLKKFTKSLIFSEHEIPLLLTNSKVIQTSTTKKGFTCIARNKTCFAVGCDDFGIRVWDNESIKEFTIHEKPLTSLSFINEDEIISTSEDCTAKIYNLCQQRIIETLKFNGRVWSATCQRHMKQTVISIGHEHGVDIYLYSQTKK